MVLLLIDYRWCMLEQPAPSTNWIEAASIFSFYLQLRVLFSFFTSSFWAVGIMSFLSRSLEFSHNCPHNNIEADLYLVSIYTEGKYDLVNILIFRSLNNVQKSSASLSLHYPKGNFQTHRDTVINICKLNISLVKLLRNKIGTFCCLCFNVHHRI